MFEVSYRAFAAGELRCHLCNMKVLPTQEFMDEHAADAADPDAKTPYGIHDTPIVEIVECLSCGENFRIMLSETPGPEET